MPLQPGIKLGPYKILAPAGAGGMGEVYKAADTRLNRTVAIKVLPEHFSQDAEMKQRFEREAQAIAAMNHPHICTLYDVGQQDGAEFLAICSTIVKERCTRIRSIPKNWRSPARPSASPTSFRTAPPAPRHFPHLKRAF